MTKVTLHRLVVGLSVTKGKEERVNVIGITSGCLMTRFLLPKTVIHLVINIWAKLDVKPI
jgi:hypothetical protein